MKKALMILAAVTAMAGAALAAPTATVTFSMSGNRFYQDAALTTLTQAGWYIEVILSANNNAYNGSTLAAYQSYVTIPGTVGAGSVGVHQTGKFFDGTATTAGRASIQWTYTDTTYVNYYATLRFYNAATKEAATKYGVLVWKDKVTALPSDTIPRPSTADQSISWGSTLDKNYTKYDVPAVPEPTTMALFGLGGLALVLRRKLRKDA